MQQGLRIRTSGDVVPWFSVNKGWNVTSGLPCPRVCVGGVKGRGTGGLDLTATAQVIKLKLLQCVLLHRGKAEMVVEIGTVPAVLVQ